MDRNFAWSKIGRSLKVFSCPSSPILRGVFPLEHKNSWREFWAGPPSFSHVGRSRVRLSVAWFIRTTAGEEKVAMCQKRGRSEGSAEDKEVATAHEGDISGCVAFAGIAEVLEMWGSCQQQQRAIFMAVKIGNLNLKRATLGYIS